MQFRMKWYKLCKYKIFPTQEKRRHSDTTLPAMNCCVLLKLFLYKRPRFFCWEPYRPKMMIFRAVRCWEFESSKVRQGLFLKKQKLPGEHWAIKRTKCERERTKTRLEMPQQLCKLKRAVSRDFQPTYFCYCIKKLVLGHIWRD